MLEVALYGGAVLTIVYGSRDSTRDVDAIISPAEADVRLVAQVAKDQELTEDWLNEDVRQFVSSIGQKRAFPSDEFEPGLQITIPTVAYLLSLKLNACRQPLPGYLGDKADIKFLLRKIEPASVETIEEIQDQFFPGEGLHPRALELIEDYLAEASS